MIGTIDSWLIYNITEEKQHLTDITNASRTFMMNLKTLDWDEDILKTFGIKKNILPSIKPCSDDFGSLNIEKWKHVKISGVMGD